MRSELDRRAFLRGLFGAVVAAPVLVQPNRVYSFLWNNPLTKDAFEVHPEFFIGFENKPYLEAGYIYAPYIPMYETPSFVIDDFKKMMLDEDGVVRQEFYGRGVLFK